MDNFKNGISDTAQEAYSSLKEELLHGSDHLTEAASRKISELKNVTAKAANGLKEDAQWAASEANRKADASLSHLGHKIADAGTEIGKRAKKGGRLDDLANRTQSAGEYLSDHPSKELAADFSSFISRHPLKSLAASLAVGVWVGLKLRNN